MPDLVVKSMSKRFGDQIALDDISFTVKDGEFFTLLGPSGCGKSSTLACIAGLDRPEAGSIYSDEIVYVDAKKNIFLPPEKRNLGMVFQSYALWPHMTVKANLALPLKLRGVSRHEKQQRIDKTLDQVGLLAFKDRYPHQLSGGQQQRVALARALVYSPSLLLLDEPLSNLDAKLRERARAWLKELQQTVGITTIYVTHDQVEALSLSDRLMVMRDGQALQIGSPAEVYEQPARAEVADFIGRCNFFSARLLNTTNDNLVDVEVEGYKIQLKQKSDTSNAEFITLGLRSERLSVIPPRGDTSPESLNALPAELVRSAYIGARYEYELNIAGQLVFAEGDINIEARHVWLVIPKDGAYIFPDQQSKRARQPPETETTA